VTKEKLQLISRISSKQCQYILIKYCIATRLHHFPRTIRPALIQDELNIHQDAIFQFLQNLIVTAAGIQDEPFEQFQLDQISLPHSMGGLAIADVSKNAPLIHLAAFRRAISLLHEIIPNIQQFIHELSNSNSDLTNYLNYALALLKSFDPNHLDSIDHIYSPQVAKSLSSAYLDKSQKNSQTGLLARFQHPGNTDIISKFHHIRLISCTERGALAFLEAIPSTRQLRLHNDHFVIALRRVLGMKLLPSTLSNLPCVCGKSLSDIHVQICTYVYEISKRHNNAVGILRSIFQAQHIPSLLEIQVGVGKFRYDIRTQNLYNDENLDFFDFQATSPFQKDYLESPNTYRSGQAMEDAFKVKKREYDKFLTLHPPGTKFTPLICSSYGANHADLNHLLHHIGHNFAEHKSPTDAAFNARQFVPYWTQVLSCSIHRGTATSVIETLNRTCKNRGLPLISFR
jgi:hypothetical protein